MTNIAVLNSQLFTWDVSLAALAVRPSAIVKICEILGAIWRVHLLGVFVANGFCCRIGSLEGSPTVLHLSPQSLALQDLRSLRQDEQLQLHTLRLPCKQQCFIFIHFL